MIETIWEIMVNLLESTIFILFFTRIYWQFIIINCSDTLAPDLSYDHMDAQLSLDTNTTWRIPL